MALLCKEGIFVPYKTSTVYDQHVILTVSIQIGHFWEMYSYQGSRNVLKDILQST